MLCPGRSQLAEGDESWEAEMTRSMISAIPVELLGRLPIFAGLTPEQAAIASRDARQVALAKGAVLFRRGDPSRCIYFVLNGQMQLTVSAPGGAEKVVEIIAAGQSFGEAVAFLGRPYPVTAVALVRTDLLAVSTDAVLDLLDRDPLFARRMLANMATRLHRMVDDVESYTLRSGIQRVAGFLLHRVPDNPCQLAAEQTVTLPVSKHVLASRLNLAPETLSRILHELSTAGLISVRGRLITLHDVRRLTAELEWR